MCWFCGRRRHRPSALPWPGDEQTYESLSRCICVGLDVGVLGVCRRTSAFGRRWGGAFARGPGPALPCLICCTRPSSAPPNEQSLLQWPGARFFPHPPHKLASHRRSRPIVPPARRGPGRLALPGLPRGVRSSSAAINADLISGGRPSHGHHRVDQSGPEFRPNEAARPGHRQLRHDPVAAARQRPWAPPTRMLSTPPCGILAHRAECSREGPGSRLSCAEGSRSASA